MKINDLLDRIKANGLNLPESGSGRNGRILSVDLENVLGNYFTKLKYKDPDELEHLKMRRWYVPPKAYRFKDLNDVDKKEVFRSDNGWVLEQKFNGWRMIITFVPGNGYMFWGGNISDVDFLPVDYTDKVVLCSRHPQNASFKYDYTNPFILDSEAICETDVEMLDSNYSNNTLDAVKAILGSDKARAIKLQAGHTLDFHLFDYVSHKPNADNDQFGKRGLDLDTFMSTIGISQFHRTEQFYVDKKIKLQELWRMGHEGCILKNLEAQLIPGSRSKHINIKVKRSMSGAIGDDLDAFISGYILTKEWSKKDLIGGIQLSVYSNGAVHHIATVTAMPDTIRHQLTLRHYNRDMHVTAVLLAPTYMNKVLVVDGQELSARNKMILHATVDWNRGFRKTKRAEDCIFNIEAVEKERF